MEIKPLNLETFSQNMDFVLNLWNLFYLQSHSFMQIWMGKCVLVWHRNWLMSLLPLSTILKGENAAAIVMQMWKKIISCKYCCIVELEFFSITNLLSPAHKKPAHKNASIIDWSCLKNESFLCQMKYLKWLDFFLLLPNRLKCVERHFPPYFTVWRAWIPLPFSLSFYGILWFFSRALHFASVCLFNLRYSFN